MTNYAKEWRNGERKQRSKLPNFESKVGSNATKRNRKFRRTGLGWEITGLGLINERHRNIRSDLLAFVRTDPSTSLV